MYLTFNGLTKRFGAVTAVQNVSFSIDRGEFVSLLGPSGCGKTTTLMLLAGFETPDAGCIVLDNVDLAGLPPEKRGVGVVFQHYALFPHMTVADNIAFSLVHGNTKGMTHAAVRARVNELLHIVDLEPYAQRKPAQLSAGQQQRVAIARSLAPHPRVICFDEPLSALDALLREKLRLEIRRLQRELNLTVLYVTHDQEEALAISDRVVVMSNGKVAQWGSPWEVYDRPSNAFVAAFIGKGSLLPGRLVDVGDGFHIELTGGQAINVPKASWCGQHLPQSGEDVDVVLRAERARAGNDLVKGPDDIVLSGRLLEVEFLGGHIRLHIEGIHGQIMISAPTAEYTYWHTLIGSQVSVSYRPDDVRIVNKLTSKVHLPEPSRLEPLP